MSFRMKDLPPHVVACIPKAERLKLGVFEGGVLSSHCPKQKPPESAKETQQSASCETTKKRSVGFRCPNATELAYLRMGLVGVDARYEALTFRLANGHRYTPDWVVFVDGAPVACHEVKGAYRLHSHGRARLAFDQARIEFPGLTWVWGVVRRAHLYDCEVYRPGEKQ